MLLHDTEYNNLECNFEVKNYLFKNLCQLTFLELVVFAKQQHVCMYLENALHSMSFTSATRDHKTGTRI
jgi:hypothetical protein